MLPCQVLNSRYSELYLLNHLLIRIKPPYKFLYLISQCFFSFQTLCFLVMPAGIGPGDYPLRVDRTYFLWPPEPVISHSYIKTGTIIAGKISSFLHWQISCGEPFIMIIRILPQMGIFQSEPQVIYCPKWIQPYRLFKCVDNPYLTCLSIVDCGLLIVDRGLLIVNAGCCVPISHQFLRQFEPVQY